MRSIYDPVFAAMPTWHGPKENPPFRVRGIVYQRDLARIEASTPGGVQGLLAQAHNPALSAYFRQSFAAHRYYDAVPVVLLSHYDARSRGLTIQQHARETSRDYAQASLAGTMGLVVKRIPLSTIAEWLPKAAAWFHDFGRVETRMQGDRLMRATRTQLPGFLVLGYGIAATEFVDAVFRHSGAKSTRTYPLAVEDDGVVDGQPVYRVSFEIAWTE